MKCKDVRRCIGRGAPIGVTDREGLALHSSQCEDCRKLLAVEQIAAILIRAHQDSSVNDENPYLMVRIRARIRELSEQGVGSWEAAILTLRSWLIAFGAAAVILLTISVLWQFSLEAASPDPDNEIISLSSNGDFSSNARPALELNEAIDNDHK